MTFLKAKVKDKKCFEIRNEIFTETGLPALAQNGFIKSPFSTAWFGKNNLGDFTYELCRLSEDSHLEMIITHISKNDNWIKIHLNIFELDPQIDTIQQLDGVDGLHYHLPPNSLTLMRLRLDDVDGIPLFNYHFMFGGHKLKSFRTEAGLNQRIKGLSDLIKNDLTNIDIFVKRWYKRHKPNLTDWKGHDLKKGLKNV